MKYYGHFMVLIRSFCGRFAVDLRSFCGRFAVVLQSFCGRFVVVILRSFSYKKFSVVSDNFNVIHVQFHWLKEIDFTL